MGHALAQTLPIDEFTVTVFILSIPSIRVSPAKIYYYGAFYLLGQT